MAYTNTNRRDANEASLVALWERCGCVWVPMPPGVGFDGILLHYFSGIFIVEIKMPGSYKLTAKEVAMKDKLEAHGITYRIIQTEVDAARLIGADVVWDITQKAGALE